MYAIIKTGGKQYKVQKGGLIDVELLEGTDGDSVEFSDVLFIGGKNATIGGPVVTGSTVQGKIVETTYGEKINGMTYKRRKNVRRRYGHRQRYTRVEITDIKAK